MSLEYNPNDMNGWGAPGIWPVLGPTQGQVAWKDGFSFVYYWR